MPSPRKYGDPNKPAPIDRAKYESFLKKPINYGNNFIGDEGTFNADVLGVNGFKIHYGSEANGDLIAQKGDDYYLYNKIGNQRGLVNIGNPYATSPQSTTGSALVDQLSTPVKPTVDPNRKPIQFSQNYTFDPNTNTYHDYSGKEIKVNAQSYKHGGSVKGYAYGTGKYGITGENILGSEAPPMTGSDNGFSSALAAGLQIAGGIGAQAVTNEVKDDPNALQHTKSNDALLAAVGPTAANAVLPGSGALVAPALAMKAAWQNNAEGVDPITGKWKNENQAHLYGAANGILNASPLGALGVVMDKDKSFGEKALAVGTGGLSNLVTWKKDSDKAEASNMEKVQREVAEKKQKEQEAIRNANLGSAIAERANFADGGTVDGPGTAKSDSVKAKIKPGSFVVPAENALAAKLLLGNEAEKPANLNQSQGVDVNLSKGEVVIDPKKKNELINKGVDITELAPNAATKDKVKLTNDQVLKAATTGMSVSEFSALSGLDRERIMKMEARVRSQNSSQKNKADRANYSLNTIILKGINKINPLSSTTDEEFDRKAAEEYKRKFGEYPKLLTQSYKNGGEVKPSYSDGTTPIGVQGRKGTTGNKEFDKELDSLSKKKYTSAKEVKDDLNKLHELQDKSISLYGKRNPELDLHISKLNKAEKDVQVYEKRAQQEAEASKEIESTKKLLKEKGATDSEIYGYETKLKKGPDRFYDKKREEFKNSVISNILARSAKSNAEAAKEVLKTKGASFYRKQLVDATKNLELAKANPSKYTKDQIDGFQKDISTANENIASMNDAIKKRGVPLVDEYYKYQKLSGDKPAAGSVTVPTGSPAATTTASKMEAPTESFTDQVKRSLDPLQKVADAQKKTDVPVTATTGVKASGDSALVKKATAKPVEAGTPFSRDWTANDPSSQVGFNPPSIVTPAIAEKPVMNEYTSPVAATTVSNNATDNAATGLLSKINGSEIANYAIPALQTAMGLNSLKQAGDRPIRTIDPDFTKAINGAQNNLALLKSDAKFGYSPEELALLREQNNSATNASRYAARDLSGGSAANAFVMERAANNEGFSRGLETKIADKQEKLRKALLVTQAQQRLDNLYINKADRTNEIYNDSLVNWNQNQVAGANLVGAGLSNAVSAGRYNDEIEANKRRDAKYNPQYPT